MVWDYPESQKPTSMTTRDTEILGISFNKGQFNLDKKQNLVWKGHYVGLCDYANSMFTHWGHDKMTDVLQMTFFTFISLGHFLDKWWPIWLTHKCATITQ